MDGEGSMKRGQHSRVEFKQSTVAAWSQSPYDRVSDSRWPNRLNCCSGFDISIQQALMPLSDCQ